MFSGSPLHSISSQELQHHKYRLPKIATPISYKLRFAPRLTSTFPFEGHANIHVKILEDSQILTLHSKRLNIVRVVVKDEQIVNMKILSVEEDPEHDLISITLESKFIRNKEYDIEFEFSGYLSDDMTGFYRCSYYNNHGEKRWLAGTQFAPINARGAFPCFDEPEYKATFTTTIIAPKGYHSQSNTALTRLLERKDGLTEYEFQETTIMPTYQVAFVITDFITTTSNHEKYEFSTWSREAVVHDTEYSVQIGNSLLLAIEDYMGFEYTNAKVDQIAMPEKINTSEQVGLVIYWERDIVFQEGYSTEMDKKKILLLISHEMAHTWFGSLVTLQWWSDTWLNEGFARYFEYHAVHTVVPDWRLLDQFVVDISQRILFYDSFLDTAPMSTFCRTPKEIMAKFDKVTCDKGAAVLRMVSHIMKPQVFQKGIQRYINTYEWKNVIPQNLFDALEEERKLAKTSGYDVSQFFKQWITQPGYPVISIIRDHMDITVKQERFMIDYEDDEKVKWYVPLNWTVQSTGLVGFSTTTAKTWLLPSEDIKKLKIDVKRDEWVIFNNQATGFYRVNYDEESWYTITLGLLQDHMKVHVLNRAQLVDDVLNLSRSGKVHYTLALGLCLYLNDEEDYIPWVSATRGLQFIDSRLTAHEEDYNIFRNYMLLLVHNMYEKLGMEEKASDDHITKLHRAIIAEWASHLGHRDCIAKAINMFNMFQKSEKENPIPPNLRQVVYSAGIQEGGDVEWNFLWKQFTSTTAHTEREEILKALGCSKNEDLLRTYLQNIFEPSPTVKRRDAIGIFESVASNPKGFPVALEFMKDFQRIYKRFGNYKIMENFFEVITKKVTKEHQVTELETFINHNCLKLGPEVFDAGTNAVTTGLANVMWTKMYKESIIHWIQQLRIVRDEKIESFIITRSHDSVDLTASIRRGSRRISLNHIIRSFKKRK